MLLPFEGGHYLRAVFIFSFTWQKKMEFQSFVRGHHVYKCVWTPVNGKELCDIPEDINNHDAHAIAVMKDGQVVGHVPREISRILYFYLLEATFQSCVVRDNQ